METILMSIHPKWCEKIFSGEKTIEVRKTAPKETPFKALIYCTQRGLSLTRFKFNGEYIYSLNKKDEFDFESNAIGILNGKVIGEFICDETDTYQYEDSRQLMLGTYHNKELLLYETCLTSQELDNYAKGKVVKLLHITSPRLYDKPRELGEFRKAGYANDREAYCAAGAFGVSLFFYEKAYKLTRPPQSWQYIEDKEE